MDTSIARIKALSRNLTLPLGNGKRHSTPSPVELKKIKRVGFDVFLSLKELVNVNRIKIVRKITPREVNRKKSVFKRESPGDVRERRSVYELEPGQATRLFNSYPRRWNRVNQWHEYINDTGKTNKRDT